MTPQEGGAAPTAIGTTPRTTPERLGKDPNGVSLPEGFVRPAGTAHRSAEVRNVHAFVHAAGSPSHRRMRSMRRERTANQVGYLLGIAAVLASALTMLAIIWFVVAAVS